MVIQPNLIEASSAGSLSVVEQESRIVADVDVSGFVVSPDVLSETQCSALRFEVASLEVAGTTVGFTLAACRRTR
jgi:hypothetical protein